MYVFLQLNKHGSEMEVLREEIFSWLKSPFTILLGLIYKSHSLSHNYICHGHNLSKMEEGIVLLNEPGEF